MKLKRRVRSADWQDGYWYGIAVGIITSTLWFYLVALVSKG